MSVSTATTMTTMTTVRGSSWRSWLCCAFGKMNGRRSGQQTPHYDSDDEGVGGQRGDQNNGGNGDEIGAENAFNGFDENRKSLPLYKRRKSSATHKVNIK